MNTENKYGNITDQVVQVASGLLASGHYTSKVESKGGGFEIMPYRVKGESEDKPGPTMAVAHAIGIVEEAHAITQQNITQE